MSFPFGSEHFQIDAQPVNPVIAGYLGKAALAHMAPPKRRILSLDFETWSTVDLKKAGASRYARDPSTEILVLAYRWLGEEEVHQWVPAAGEPMPQDLLDALLDPSVTLSAWNAPFERAITEHVLKVPVPIERWMDVMALAYSLSLPGSLDKCGKIVGLGEDKRKLARGKLLVRKFCGPRKPSKLKPWTRETAETAPEEWQEFLEYNRQDVVAEQAIYRKIRRWQMPDHEWALWHLDQKINDAGIPINLKAVEAAIRLSRATMVADLKEMKALTGLANPNSNPQLLAWLRAEGYPYLDLKKGHVDRALKAAQAEIAEAAEFEVSGPLGDYMAARWGKGRLERLARVLYLRSRVSKASVKKYPALLNATDFDGMLRGCHQFAGAGRTWRWSGRRFQPQNLPKPEKYLEERIAECVADVENLSVEEVWAKWENPMDVLVASVRPMVQSPEGFLLIDADLSAIENVVLGWVADEDKILRVFREGLDPYIDFATDMFRMSYEEIDKSPKRKAMRSTAKPGVLGCGYMLGPGEARENPQTGEIEGTGLLGYGWNMGVDLTPEMSKLSVDTFRGKFTKVVDFWYEIEAVVKRVIRTGQPETLRYLTFDMSGPFMRIGLPSGRFLHYLNPRLQVRKMPWGAEKLSITYENIEKGHWRRVTTHPGKLTENVVQAIARDLLAHGMTLADRAGLDIRMHVHDQIVGLHLASTAKAALDLLIRCMTTLPAWANEKLPLKAAGLVTPIFLKD